MVLYRLSFSSFRLVTNLAFYSNDYYIRHIHFPMQCSPMSLGILRLIPRFIVPENHHCASSLPHNMTKPLKIPWVYIQQHIGSTKPAYIGILPPVRLAWVVNIIATLAVVEFAVFQHPNCRALTITMRQKFSEINVTMNLGLVIRGGYGGHGI